MKLLRDQDGWKVFLNWKEEKQKQEDQRKQTEISQLLADAEKLGIEKNLTGAIEKYEKVLKLDSQSVDAIEGVNKAREEISKFQEKQNYVDQIALYDLECKYYETFLDKKVPGVKLKLKNNGNKTLKEVEVTVYFKDNAGEVIFEESLQPVSDGIWGGSNPLKPNYIWQNEKDEFFKVRSVPREWKEGAVSARITDLEFMENEEDVQLLWTDEKKSYLEKITLYDLNAEIHDI